MIDQLEIDNFQQLFQNNTPLMDVRAPVEYSRGSFPGVLNAPLMTDNERHKLDVASNRAANFLQ